MAKRSYWCIDVTKSGGSFVPDPLHAAIPLAAGDLVFWRFDPPVELEEVPHLHFLSENGSTLRHPLGPFISIEQLVKWEQGKQVVGEIVGTGFNGSTGKFHYSLKAGATGPPWQASRAADSTLEVSSPTPTAWDACEVTVSLILQKKPHDQSSDFDVKLQLHPESCHILPGQHVVWNIEVPYGLFPNQVWYPEILFKHSDGQEDHLGPFTARSVIVKVARDDAADKAQPRSIRIVYSGRRSYEEAPKGRYAYTAKIYTPDGKEYVSSGDPAVDDDGDVKPAPGGGSGSDLTGTSG